MRCSNILREGRQKEGDIGKMTIPKSSAKNPNEEEKRKVVAGAGFEKTLPTIDITRFMFLAIHFVHCFVHEKISATISKTLSN